VPKKLNKLMTTDTETVIVNYRPTCSKTNHSSIKTPYAYKSNIIVHMPMMQLATRGPDRSLLAARIGLHHRHTSVSN